MGNIIPILLAQEATSQQLEAEPGQIGSGLIGYLIMAFFCDNIYQKLNIENAWFAWIIILDTHIFNQADYLLIFLSKSKGILISNNQDINSRICLIKSTKYYFTFPTSSGNISLTTS